MFESKKPFNDPLYLSFITSIYFTAVKHKNIKPDDRWFLEEIATFMLNTYPDRSYQEILTIMTHIVKQAKTMQKS